MTHDPKGAIMMAPFLYTIDITGLLFNNSLKIGVPQVFGERDGFPGTGF